MLAARAFGVEGPDGAAHERRAGGLDEAGFVQGVGVDGDLHVVLVGHGEAIVDRGRRRAPVLVQLEAIGPGLDLLLQRRGRRGVALALEAEVHRKRIGRLQHALQVPGSGRAGGGEGAGGRARAPAQHGGDPGHQRLLNLLRADEVDVRVDAAGGDDHALAGDDLGARADDDVDARLDIRIARLADAADASVFERDVGLDDAPVIDDHRVGDHGVGAVLRHALALAHAVADDLATAELHFLAIDRMVLLDLDPQAGIGEAHAVAGGWTEHLGISLPADLECHLRAPFFFAAVFFATGLFGLG